MLEDKKSYMIEQILSESIWQYYNLIKKYFQFNKNYVDIIFYALNSSNNEISWLNYLKNIEFKLKELLSPTIKISKEQDSNILIGQKNDIRAFIKYENTKDKEFLYEFSKFLYLMIKKIEINSQMAKEVIFKQFIIDKNDSIILILDENDVIENYNLKAISFFKYDIRGKKIDLYIKNQKLIKPQNSYDSIYMDLIVKKVEFKAKISSYKSEKTLIELISL
ncbi:MAG: hypothetical protein ACQESN_05940 [Thermotogota bacterium]